MYEAANIAGAYTVSKLLPGNSHVAHGTPGLLQALHAHPQFLHPHASPIVQHAIYLLPPAKQAILLPASEPSAA